MLETVGRKFARFATNTVVRRPQLWPLFRAPLRRQFDVLAPQWDTMRSAGYLASFEAALAGVDPPPRRALDVGTGTGAGAVAIARRFPDAEVVGVDLSAAMVAEARRKLPAELASRVQYEVADASRLPYDDDAFDLVALANMIPFFSEIARVLAPQGVVLFAFSGGAGTPIYVPSERLRRELAPRGFTDFAEIEAGTGTAFLARRADGH
jgi:SAM-dependent methyltransferase